MSGLLAAIAAAPNAAQQLSSPEGDFAGSLRLANAQAGGEKPAPKNQYNDNALFAACASGLWPTVRQVLQSAPPGSISGAAAQQAVLDASAAEMCTPSAFCWATSFDLRCPTLS